jgi:hypothetical protein
MPTTLIPNSFWFRMAFPCLRCDGVPRAARKVKGKGNARILDLPEACRLPETPRLHDAEPFADVRTAWNPGGLAVQVSVAGKLGPVTRDPVLPDASDGVQLWIDTRDTRDVHRATRFCHRYAATLAPARGGGLGVEVEQRKIHRAAADPGGTRAGAVTARAERTRDGWLLELFFAADALHGFDPDTNRRLGFCYQVTDPERGDQWLGVGRDFPIAEDPSLWATLELRDEAP